jgi:TM2 domain-containing membrane protein YozV
MSLGLNNNSALNMLAPEPVHRSAGLAFLLSLIIPGAGQFYCGKITRGVVTFIFWALGFLPSFIGTGEWRGYGYALNFVVWIFSFLDAYFTAIEINQGHGDLLDGKNPRIASTLNLLTAGFGYFYLGEPAKGVALFLVVQIGRMAVPKTTGLTSVAILAAFFIVQVLMALDGYRIARNLVKEALEAERQLKESHSRQATLFAPVTPSPYPSPTSVPSAASRLPAFIPIGVACLLVFGVLTLALIGWIAKATGFNQRLAANRARKPVTVSAPAVVLPSLPFNDHVPIDAIDLPTAVRDVQRAQRLPSLPESDIQYLKHDAGVFDVMLKTPLNDREEISALYYRALAHTLINVAYQEAGKPMDPVVARAAIADFNKVIAQGNRGDPASVQIGVANTQYWAGHVARNQLRDTALAYSYWKKCAAGGHVGCMTGEAFGRVTGEDGGKVDPQGALALYATAYESGIRYRCAAAFSGISMAEIDYFMGVHLPGGDPSQWIAKTNELLDQLQAQENDPGVCQRAEIEVEEFLFGLSTGERNNGLLQDAVERLGDNSKATRAVIQWMLDAIDQPAMESAINSSYPENFRCSAYFNALWYAKLEKQDAIARRDYQHLVDLGKFYCGEELVYARKYKF